MSQWIKQWPELSPSSEAMREAPGASLVTGLRGLPSLEGKSEMRTALTGSGAAETACYLCFPTSTTTSRRAGLSASYFFLRIEFCRCNQWGRRCGGLHRAGRVQPGHAASVNSVHARCFLETELFVLYHWGLLVAHLHFWAWPVCLSQPSNRCVLKGQACCFGSASGAAPPYPPRSANLNLTLGGIQISWAGPRVGGVGAWDANLA